MDHLKDSIPSISPNGISVLILQQLFNIMSYTSFKYISFSHTIFSAKLPAPPPIWSRVFLWIFYPFEHSLSYCYFPHQQLSSRWEADSAGSGVFSQLASWSEVSLLSTSLSFLLTKQFVCHAVSLTTNVFSWNLPKIDPLVSNL